MLLEQPKMYVYRDYKYINMNNLLSDVSNTNWSCFYNNVNVNERAEHFNFIIGEFIDKHMLQ